jgi:hypothetical protein
MALSRADRPSHVMLRICRGSRGHGLIEIVPRTRTRLLIVLGLTGLSTLAAAQSKKPAPKFAIPGSADSVSMGSKDAAPRRAPARGRSNAAVATFPGFRLLPNGASRIYVELTRQVAVDERRGDGTLIYVIHDARVPARNNRNALITTHFSTPVGRARLLSSGADVQLVIDLRKNTSATQKIVAGENGGARLEVDFPAGDYPPAPGLFEPSSAKGRGRDVEEPETDEAASPPSATAPGAPAPSSNVGNAANARPAPAAADPTRAAPSAAPSSAPTPR